MSKTVATTPAKEIIIRDPGIIAAEINSLKQQTWRIVLGNSIEIGKLLVEAKDSLPHGQWGKWLEESVSYSQSTANNLMRIYEEYGSKQASLWGPEASSQALGNLNYTQAVALLGLPAEEREAFVEQNDVQAMSTRELQAAIKANADLKKQLDEEREKARLAAEENEMIDRKYNELDKQRQEDAEALKQAREELAAAQKSGDKKELAKLQKKLEKAESASEASQNRIKELESQMAEQIKQKEVELESNMKDRIAKREQELMAQSEQEKQALRAQMDKLSQQLARANNEPFLKAKMAIEQIIQDGDVLVKSIAAVTEKEEQDKLKKAAASVVDQLIGMIKK